MSVTRRLSSEAGFGLVEVLVTAMIVLILASGVLAGLDAASHASGRVKQRSVAMTLAQQDQERLRAMVIGDLANVRESQTRTITVCSDSGNSKGCTAYTVASQADWVSDSAGVESCTQATSKDFDFDYLKITSKVTWPNMDVNPVMTESLLTPRVGDIGKNTGNLAVKILRADGVTGVPNVRVSLTGPDSATDVTNSAGCVVWGALTAGNGYTISINEPGFVGANGTQAVTKPVGVLADSLTTTSLLYDGAASASISLSTVSNSKTYPAQTDRVSLSQSQMLPVTRTFGTAGTPAATVAATSLFPFKAASQGGRYVVFAGDCDGENPNSQDPPEILGNLQTLPDLSPGAAASVTIQVPSIDTRVTVQPTSQTTSIRTADQAGDQAQLKFTETTTGCLNGGTTTSAVQTATGQDPGHPAAPGVRYGAWTVCAQANLGSTYGVRSVRVSNVTVSSLSGATVTSGPNSGAMNVAYNSTAGGC